MKEEAGSTMYPKLMRKVSPLLYSSASHAGLRSRPLPVSWASPCRTGEEVENKEGGCEGGRVGKGRVKEICLVCVLTNVSSGGAMRPTPTATSVRAWPRRLLLHRLLFQTASPPSPSSLRFSAPNSSLTVEPQAEGEEAKEAAAA
eukprot:764096-Hanusia_phi.AAC.3